MKQYTFKEFVRIVTSNDFSLKRWSGDHAIYENERGRHVSIPIHLNSVIARRLIKENKLKLDLK